MSNRPQAAPDRVRAAASSLAVDAFTVEAIESLERAGLRPLLLKGPALATLLYDADEERHWADADLLVDVAEEDRALAALQAIGFETIDASTLERDRVPYEIQLARPAVHGEGSGRACEVVDLHRSFVGVEADAAVFWASVDAGRESMPLFGRGVGVPSTPARLAMVALHAGGHGRSMPQPLRDLRRAVSRFGACPEMAAAIALARHWEALDYFVAGIRLDPAGEQLLAELGVRHEPSRAARMHAAGMGPAEFGLEHFARAGRTRDRVRLVARTLVPGPARMRRRSRLAARGPLGLVLAYLLRPLWLAGQLALALGAYLRASRRR